MRVFCIICYRPYRPAFVMKSDIFGNRGRRDRRTPQSTASSRLRRVDHHQADICPRTRSVASVLARQSWEDTPVRVRAPAPAL